MKVWIATIAAAAALVVAGPAAANKELAQKSGCLACHAVDKKVVGPSYQEIAAKYKGKADAPAMLAKKVKEGGKGAWGEVPMPPNANVKDDDIKTLVAWIMAGAK